MRLSVRTGSPRRRMLLLLTAVFVPYLVLAALSLRMLGQQLLALLQNFKLRQLAQLPPPSRAG